MKLTLKSLGLESGDVGFRVLNSLSMLLNKYLQNLPPVQIASVDSSFICVKETIVLDSKKSCY